MVSGVLLKLLLGNLRHFEGYVLGDRWGRGRCRGGACIVMAAKELI